MTSLQVTGGAGFIGSSLVNQACEISDAERIVVIDDSPTGGCQSLSSMDVKFHEASILKSSAYWLPARSTVSPRLKAKVRLALRKHAFDVVENVGRLAEPPNAVGSQIPEVAVFGSQDHSIVGVQRPRVAYADALDAFGFLGDDPCVGDVNLHSVAFEFDDLRRAKVRGILLEYQPKDQNSSNTKVNPPMDRHFDEP